jgi:hypothetical protein
MIGGMRGLFLIAVAGLALSACSSHPPATWAPGGSPVEIPRARWQRGSSAADIMPDGRVLVDGSHSFSIDRAGRVFEPDNSPIALLEPDGRLIGKDDVLLGVIGMHNSSLPGRTQAWLTVGEQGEVILYDDEGERRSAGTWTGCGQALRTCTLVTHVIAMATVRQRGNVGIGFGIGSRMGGGMGTGFGVLVFP